MTTTERATTQLQADLTAAIDRLAYTDPESGLYSHERGYIGGIRHALALLGVDPADLPETPANTRNLRRHPDQTDQLNAISDTHT